MKVNGVEAELVNDWQSVTSTLLKEDGYLVSGSRKERAIDSIEIDPFTSLPFRIIDEATYEDALRQFRRLVSLVGQQEEELIPPPRNYKFYKVVVAD